MECAIEGEVLLPLVAIEALRAGALQHLEHAWQGLTLGLQARRHPRGAERIEQLERALAQLKPKRSARSTLTMSSAISGIRSAA